MFIDIPIDDLIGYSGVFFLLIRFIPVLIKEVKNLDNLNYRSIEPGFIVIETLASVLLGTSALIKTAMPFVIANWFTVSTYMLLFMIFLIKMIKRNKIFQKNIWAAPPPKN